MLPDLELPENLIKEYNNNKLVIFVGAGISQLCGCKSWASLANDLVNTIFDRATANQIIKGGYGQKDKITMSFEQAKKTRKTDEYWATFKNAIDPRKVPELSIYREICSLRTFVVTTNCDSAAEQFFATRDISKECSTTELEKAVCPHLFYLHGRYGEGTESDKQTLVFTTDSYLKAYRPDNPRVGFLKHIFQNYTVLFLGYGLSEFELLDFLFLKSSSSNQHMHYVLNGYFSYEEPLREARALYYGALGIQQLVYVKDDKGYEAQIEVIRAWVNQLQDKTYLQSLTIDDLRRCMKEPNIENKTALRRILAEHHKGSKTMLHTAFQIAPETGYGVEWMLYFWDYGCISETDFATYDWDSSGVQFLKGLEDSLRRAYVYLPDELNNRLSNVLQKVMEILQKDDQRIIREDSRMICRVISLMPFLHSDSIDESIFRFLDKCFLWQYEDTVNDLSGEIQMLKNWNEGHVSALIDLMFDRLNLEDPACSGSLGIFADFLMKTEEKYAQKLMACAFSKEMEGGDERFYLTVKERLGRENSVKPIIEMLVLCADQMYRDGRLAEQMKELAKEAVTTKKIQILFYFATKFDHDPAFLKFLPRNPFNAIHTWADFYHYLKQCNEAYICLPEEILRQIVVWIVEADFGMSTKRENKKLAEDLEVRRNSIRCLILKEIVAQNDSFRSILDMVAAHEHKEKIETEYIYKFEKTPVISDVIPKEKFYGKTAEEILDAFLIEKDSGECWFYDERDIYTHMINILEEQNKLQEALCLILDRDVHELTVFCEGLCDSKATVKENAALLMPFLDGVFSVLQDMAENEEKYRALLSAFVDLIPSAKEQKVRSDEWTDFCNRVAQVNLWKTHEEIKHIFLAWRQVEEESEGRFYIKWIENTSRCHDNNIKAESLDHLKKIIGYNGSPWPQLSLCNSFNDVVFSEGQWTRDCMKKILVGSSKKVAACILTACAETRVMIPELTDAIVEGNILPFIFAEDKTDHWGFDPCESLIHYLCCALSAGKVEKKRFLEIVVYISSNYYVSLLRALTSLEYQDDSPERICTEVIDVLRGKIGNTIEESRLANAIYGVLRMFTVLPSELADHVLWATEHANVEIWDDLATLLTNVAPQDPDMLYRLAKTALDTTCRPDLEDLKKILLQVKKTDERAFLELINHAMQKGYYPKELADMINVTSD